MSGRKWTDEEINILRSFDGKTIEEAQIEFVDRSNNSIEIKGNRLGICFKRPTFILKNEELERFKKEYPLYKRRQLLELFPQLTLSQIEDLAGRLKLNKNKNIDKVKCTKCGVIKQYIQVFFDVKNQHKHCRTCSNKLKIMETYNRKFGIKITFCKLYDTFTPVQWYHFLFETPNKKSLNQLPEEIMTDNDKLIQIFSYVFTKNEITTKEQLIRLSNSFLIKNKLHYKINYKHLRIYDIVNLVFPELEIKLWEFKTLPKYFFDDAENVKEALKWIVNKYEFKENEILVGCLNNYILRENGLRMIYEKYFNSSVVDLIKFYFQNILNKTITDKDIFKVRKVLSRDNQNVCNSIEEKLLFDFIKFDLNISQIIAIGLDRANAFYNKYYDERYYPDFMIETENKKIYIEYFGMYQERPTRKLYIDYKEKIKRKEKFYGDNGISVISIFPFDLKNEFKGVKDKLKAI